MYRDSFYPDCFTKQSYAPPPPLWPANNFIGQLIFASVRDKNLSR
jgi:hypothetical protein